MKRSHPRLRLPGGWAVCCALTVALSPVRADDETDALRPLETAVHNAAAAAGKSKTPAVVTDDDEEGTYQRRGVGSEMFLGGLRLAMASGETQQVEQMLTQIADFYPSDDVRAACAKLREDFHQQREAGDQAMVKRCRDAIGDAGRAVKAATTPADLDQTLRALADFGEPGGGDYRASEGVRAEFNRVQGARRFVTGWQDYLSERAHGDAQAATQSLRNISSSDEPDIVPRSEILARIEEVKTSGQRSVDDRAAEIVGRTKTLNDIAGSVLALQALRNGSSFSVRSDTSTLITELEFIGRIYNDYQAGLPTAVEALLNRRTGPEFSTQAMLNLREQLLRLLCARQLDAEDKFAPGPQEPIQEYLKRMMADARERCDVRLIVRLKELQTRFNYWALNDSNQSYKAPQISLRPLLAAQNQEEAGQYIPAVISYQTALKTGGDLVPAKAIGARLEAIKAAHPAEYAKGMEISLREPAADSR